MSIAGTPDTPLLRLAALSLLTAGTLFTGSPAASAESVTIDEVVVTSQRREQALLRHAGNIDMLDHEVLEQVRHQHIHELMTRVPGVWITRGSGQENLAAIRSPVLTGPGSCGAILLLEDGIPTRPAGFCNVNQLFEINSEQARSIEVIRGPGSALYGSNALHGTINVLMPRPSEASDYSFVLEVGANDFYRVRTRVPFDDQSPWRASILYADDGGFRDDSGYRQAKAHLSTATRVFGGDLVTAASISELQQETAGFIFGQDAYKDPDLNRGNVNPEAFRDASSQRVYGLWKRSFVNVDIDVRPYLRHSEMEFLQHFLPGQPLEENGHVSAGVISSASLQSENTGIVAGIDIEWSDVFLKETQTGPTQGSAFLQETRPDGKHYDYDVQSISMAPFVQADFDVSERLTLSVGARAEYMHYRYDNRMLDGNTRDDGSACGFGGCLYTRPADRSDSFTNFAPSISANFEISPDMSLYTRLGRGFRAPQMTELYRLQSGQQVADLDSEQIDNLELGLRLHRQDWIIDVSSYVMRKRNSVFRDADGFNVSGARTRHTGAEFEIDWQLHPKWRLAIDAAYGRHQYDFDRVAARGETFESGRDVDTAPRRLASAEMFFRPSTAFDLSLQWTTIGPYYLDAENRFRYPGHELFNLRAGIRLSREFSMAIRLNNVAATDVADRADFAFGEYRYFPGRGREFFVEFRYLAAQASHE